MKQYLGHWYDEQGRARGRLCVDPSDILAERGGRVSPLFHAAGEKIDGLATRGVVLFIYPASPRALLAALCRAEARQSLDGAAIFMSHGLASVVAFLPEATEVEPWANRWSEYMHAHDRWLLDDGMLVEERFVLLPGRERVAVCRDLIRPSVEMPHEVEVEVDQFAKNLGVFWSRCRAYAPELIDLGSALVDAVETTLETLEMNLAATEGAGRFAPTHYSGVANLVEINSCLTLLLSQLFSGAGPVTGGFFSVGEYSLLGIGTVARAAWRLYEHTNAIFAEENHLDRLIQLASGDPFDAAHLNPYEFAFESWIDSGIDDHAVKDEGPSRKHVIYFSSRWGFHQTMQSVSMSWQCIPSGASKEWTLLTFSHEFLHSHLREILDVLLLDATVSSDELVALFNKETAANWGESATQFLIAQLRWMSKAEGLNDSTLAGPRDGTLAERLRQRIDVTLLERLVTEHLRFLEEIATHVLDFIYFYDSKDAPYISSLWHSWSLVPNVQPQLDRYVLRCLLALASTWTSLDTSEAFDDACVRLANEFKGILDDEEHGLIREALDVLEADEYHDLRTRLRTRFQASFMLVMFVRKYLVSEVVHGKLFDDVHADDVGAYPSRPGEFTDTPIQSPIGFLVHRFGTYYSSRSRADVEYESLWQYLAIL